MREFRFTVERRFHVRFLQDGRVFSAACDCPEGQAGAVCLHVARIAASRDLDRFIAESDQATESELYETIPQTTRDAADEYVMAVEDFESTKREMDRTRRKLGTRLSLKDSEAPPPLPQAQNFFPPPIPQIEPTFMVGSVTAVGSWLKRLGLAILYVLGGISLLIILLVILGHYMTK